MALVDAADPDHEPGDRETLGRGSVSFAVRDEDVGQMTFLGCCSIPRWNGEDLTLIWIL
jgi:hypothetical protein